MMLPTYVAKGPTGGAPSLLRRLFRSREKCLILLVAFTLVFLCFGGFFYLPDDFGSERVMKVYKELQKAGPEIFIPAPPLMGPLGEGGAASGVAVETYQRRTVGDRARLNAKIEQELGRDILEKPDTGPRREEALDGAENGGGAAAEVVEEENPVGRAPDETSSLAGKVGERWFVDGADADAEVRKQRDKVKEVSVFHFMFCLYYTILVILNDIGQLRYI